MACDNNTFITGPEARMIARDLVTVHSEICAIQQAILAEIDSCTGPSSYSTTVPTLAATPEETDIAIGTGTIEDTGISSAITIGIGTGYNPDTTVLVVFDSPTGEKAILGSAVTDGSGIVSVNIVSGGSGYKGGEEVIITTDGTTGSGATATVKTVSDSGIILEIEVTNPGSDYAYNAMASVAEPTKTAFGSIQVNSEGEIPEGTEVDIADSGSGYITEPAFTVPNSNDTDYMSLPFVPVTPMTAVADTTGDDLPDSHDYYLTHINQMTSPELTDQMAFVQKYFSDLGYNIQLRVNPLTMSTLQWTIQW